MKNSCQEKDEELIVFTIKRYLHNLKNNKPPCSRCHRCLSHFSWLTLWKRSSTTSPHPSIAPRTGWKCQGVNPQHPSTSNHRFAEVLVEMPCLVHGSENLFKNKPLINSLHSSISLFFSQTRVSQGYWPNSLLPFKYHFQEKTWGEPKRRYISIIILKSEQITKPNPPLPELQSLVLIHHAITWFWAPIWLTFTAASSI